jgi:hypothetical protein
MDSFKTQSTPVVAKPVSALDDLDALVDSLDATAKEAVASQTRPPAQQAAPAPVQRM